VASTSTPRNPLDKTAFFNRVRTSVFGGSLTTAQVSGIEIILAEADRLGTNNEFLAYAIATTTWETGRTMQPIHERGARSYFDKYEPGTKIGKVLGNTKTGDGFLYRGRGYVQLTGRANYEKAGRKLGINLLGNPDLALDPKVAVRIMFLGMTEGWFTGKSFSSYLDGIYEDDAEDLREFTNARRIINGTDKAVEIGRIALAYRTALKVALRVPGVIVTPPAPADAPRPPVATPEATILKPNGTLRIIVKIITTLLQIVFRK
jgi:putative chitinase